MNDQPSFHLLQWDTHNAWRRIFEANPAPDSPEKAEGACTSLMQSIQRALKVLQPTHMLLVFDAEGPNWRHELYPEYKQHRKPMPESLRAAKPLLLDMLNEAGYAHCCIPGVEAEDVIATLAHRARGKPIRVSVASTDKDLAKLLEWGVGLWNHFERPGPGLPKGLWQDRAWWEKRFYVGPELIQDVLALAGDASDGVPGVDQIAEKGAAKLLLEYGSLDGVLAAAADGRIKGVRGEKLREQAARARISRQLVELKTDVDVGIRSLAELRLPSREVAYA